MTVSIEQAQIRLAELVDRARQGEAVDITRAGETVARLVPGDAAEKTPAPGLDDAWGKHRARLEAAGLKVPPPGAWNLEEIPSIALDDGGPSASESLVRERR